MKTSIALIFVLIISGSGSLHSQIIDKDSILTIESRESHIQEALRFRKDADFVSALNQLDSILINQPEDAPVLLLRGDILLESKKFSDAVNTYNSMIPLNYNKVRVQINLSYALFMSHKAVKALEVAKSAWQNDSLNVSAIINHFNAFLWNGKVKSAESFLAQTNHSLSSEQVLLLTARLFMIGRSYEDGLSQYGKLMDQYPNVDYAKEYIDVLLGRKEYTRADSALLNSQGYFSKLEFDSFREKLRVAQYQNAGIEYSHFEDRVKNVQSTMRFWWRQGGNQNFNIVLRASATHSISDGMRKSTSKLLGLSLNEKWGMSWRGISKIDFHQNSFSEQANYTTTSFKQTIEYQPGNRLMVGMLYNSELMSYSVEQLEERIRSSQVGYYTHLLLNSKNGFYSQGSWGRLSDGNSRIQFFGSLYHTFQSNPLLKMGVNYSTLKFKKNITQKYFSPLSYNSGEVFVDYNMAIPGITGLSLELQSGYGAQKFESKDWESSFRFQSLLILRLKHVETSIKFQTSNIASNTGTGYKFNWVTFRLAWNW